MLLHSLINGTQSSLNESNIKPFIMKRAKAVKKESVFSDKKEMKYVHTYIIMYTYMYVVCLRDGPDHTEMMTMMTMTMTMIYE